MTDEMAEGYRDGLKDDRLEMPDSIGNRSHSYRHGWLNGRDDRLGRPRARAETLRRLADTARKEDGASA